MIRLIDYMIKATSIASEGLKDVMVLMSLGVPVLSGILVWRLRM